jgi:hypothetical protein
VACTFTVTSSLSSAISTVGIVTFTTTLASLSSAEIRFAAASGGPTLTAPVDLAQPSYRTLLLGMKGSTKYTFRIVATSGAGTCTSGSYSLVTGAVPSTVPKPTTTIVDAAAHARGFIITSKCTVNGWVVIVDSDGSPVWWATSSLPDVTRAHMSWDGKDMYLVGLGGALTKVSMDGSKVETFALQAHHDLAAIPGGIVFLVYPPSTGGPYAVVERADDGTLTTVLSDVTAVYNTPTFVHPDAIHYSPWDDSYTVSDREPNLFVKISRQGELIWQFGGSNPKDASKFFQGVTPWSVNHGHHLLADGRFVFFNNGSSLVRAFELDTETMTATALWSYPTASSVILGDAQWLPNGNVLVTASEPAMRLDEIDPSGRAVAWFIYPDYLGYSEFRESLYGPPPY